MNAMDVIIIVNRMLEQGHTIDSILAQWPEDSKNYNRAWGCLVAKGLVQDPELEELMEGFGL